MQEDTPSRLVGYARPSQDMFVPQGLVAFMQTSKSASLRVLCPVFTGRKYYSTIRLWICGKTFAPGVAFHAAPILMCLLGGRGVAPDVLFSPGVSMRNVCGEMLT